MSPDINDETNFCKKGIFDTKKQREYERSFVMQGFLQTN